ncbi:hypothetical protein [Nannocystis punicea]|uniref:Uncharacterized protein n=1 Tax=Nannocystis punicea TaxID=2995304 RepID=A0ABY7HFD7_9BACT|nr:hypothetical protein [Nannocystis poenicansa]WAS97988.1 hypothetical protein O0S08_17750 [Nannocystis poenicansa]
MDELRAWFEATAAEGRAAQPSPTRFPLRATLAAEATIPASVAEARAFYAGACFDWGGAWVHRQRIGAREVFFVYVGTDGDDGWLEVFDEAGVFLFAGSFTGTRLIWEPRDAARARLASPA